MNFFFCTSKCSRKLKIQKDSFLNLRLNCCPYSFLMIWKTMFIILWNFLNFLDNPLYEICWQLAISKLTKINTYLLTTFWKPFIQVIALSDLIQHKYSNISGADPGFFKRGTPKLRTDWGDGTSAPVGKGGVSGDVHVTCNFFKKKRERDIIEKNEMNICLLYIYNIICKALFHFEYHQNASISGL